jgi:hypothetical protein
LRATPNSGFEFLYWIGTGFGATSGPQAGLSQVVIQPNGPVTELATFAPIPVPLWTVTVSPTGLPAGTSASVTLGGTTYSGAGTFTIGNLSTGTYSVSFPTAIGSGTAITEYPLTSVTATAGLSGSALTVQGDLTLSPVYATEYLVSVAVVGDGTVSSGTGSFWASAGAPLSISATPASGYVLEDWTGAFDGAASQVISNATTLEATLTGSLNVVAYFEPAPMVTTATFSLTVNESGLPAGTAWQFALAPGSGAAGSADVLTVSGLNGTYLLTIPMVYTAAGVRFVPQGTTNRSVDVSSNVSQTVMFQEQFLVLVAASGPGSVQGGGWFAAGQTVAITAVPTGAGFAGWQGSGAGSYSGTNLTPTITVAGPVSETATFSTSSISTSAAPTTPVLDYVVIVLVVAVLLAVGIAEGFVAGRRRRPPTNGPTRPPAPKAPPPATTTAPVAHLPPPAPAPSVPEPGVWSEN